jgi:nicotinamidase-related amidase
MKDCLLIIDVQIGFLTKETMHIPDRIVCLAEKTKFGHVVATKFINSENTPHYRIIGWDEMMDEGSQMLDPGIEKISERVFKKSTNSCLTEEFLEFIKNAGIEKLYMVGIDTDCCVMKTAYDCFDKEIPFEVLTDCCASTGGKIVHDAACMLMRRNLGKKSVK